MAHRPNSRARPSKSTDLVITDPPFGDNIFYSDLSNFFHVWLRLPLRLEYPELFEPTQTPNAQEALAPRVLSGEEANDHYKVRLTACWIEACRVLKDGGLLAFTFHHSEDAQWAIVLESLFDAGFLLEQTFPIASDEQKGEGGQFGAKEPNTTSSMSAESDSAQPKAVSWAKMRQWVKADLSRLKLLLAAYKANELSDADVPGHPSRQGVGVLQSSLWPSFYVRGSTTVNSPRTGWNQSIARRGHGRGKRQPAVHRSAGCIPILAAFHSQAIEKG